MIKDKSSVFDEYMNIIFSDKKKVNIDLFFEAFSVLLFYNSRNKNLVELYKLLGLENFSKVLNLFSGRNISFPTNYEFKETMIFIIIYYLKEIENKSWEDIKKEVPFDVNCKKYGIKIGHFNNYMKKELDNILKGVSNG